MTYAPFASICKGCGCPTSEALALDRPGVVRVLEAGTVHLCEDLGLSIEELFVAKPKSYGRVA